MLEAKKVDEKEDKKLARKFIIYSHYTKILKDTRLLLLYMRAVGWRRIEAAVDDVFEEIEKLERELMGRAKEMQGS